LMEIESAPEAAVSRHEGGAEGAAAIRRGAATTAAAHTVVGGTAEGAGVSAEATPGAGVADNVREVATNASQRGGQGTNATEHAAAKHSPHAAANHSLPEPPMPMDDFGPTPAKMRRNSFALVFSLYFVACAVANFGLTFQRMSAVMDTPSWEDHPAKPYICSLPQNHVWALGMLLYLLAQPLYVFVLTLAPQTVVAPLGCVIIWINAMTTRFVLGETVTATDAAGFVLIFICSALVLSFGPRDSALDPHDLNPTINTAFLAFLIVSGLICFVCCVVVGVLAPPQGSQQLRTNVAVSAAYPTLGAILASYSQTCCKAIGMLVSLYWESFVQGTWSPAVVEMLVVLGVAVLLLSGSGLWVVTEAVKILENRVFVPCFFAMEVVFMEVLGCMLYKEMGDMPLGQMAVFWSSCGICVFTVAATAVRSGRQLDEDEKGLVEKADS